MFTFDLQLFAVELTAEEQAKFTEFAKEKGWDDHADKVLKNTRDEAKAHRERAEKAEAEAKALKEAEAKRKGDDDAAAKKKADDEAAAKKKAEDEKKTFEERVNARIAELEEAFGKKLSATESKAAEKQQEYVDGLKKRDAKVLMLEVRQAAKDAGIMDVDLVGLLDLSKIKIEDGEPDSKAITELIEEHKKAKPHLYDEKRGGNDMRNRDENGRFTQERRPAAATGKDGKPIDWSTLTDQEREKLEKEVFSRSRA